MSDMSDLSPQAQAILKAYETTIGYRRGFAAVLEAVVAKTKRRQYGTCWICDANEILAIAAELRGTTTQENRNV